MLYILVRGKLGIWYLLVIFLLVCLAICFKKKKKVSEVLKKTLLLVVLMFIFSLVYVYVFGCPYPCPCGYCGSQEIDYGIKGIFSFFVKSSDLVFYEYLSYFPFIMCCSLVTIGAIKFIKRNKK